MNTKKLTLEQREKLAQRIVNDAKRLKKSGVAKSEGYSTLRKKYRVRVTRFFKAAGWKW